LVTPLPRHRPWKEDFREILAFGLTSGTDKASDAAHVASFAQADATWWLEHFAPHQTFEQVRQRIHQGPPRF